MIDSLKGFLKYFLSLFLLLSFSLFSDESKNENQPISSQKIIPQLNITELTLKNGLRVTLKPTAFEKNEVLIRFMAKGGFAKLPSQQRASAEISPQVVLESGLGDLNPDQLSVMMYENSIDFFAKVQAYSTLVEGNSGKDNLKDLLSLMHLFFTQSKFSKEAFNTVLEELKETIKKTPPDREISFENAFNEINTQGSLSSKPLDLTDLKTADFETSQHFFQEFFSRPQEFVCIIVGDFEVKNILPLIDRYLASIPTHDITKRTSLPLPKISFPTHIIKEIVHTKGRKDCLARLTLPLNMRVTEQNKPTVEFIGQILEFRLRKAFLKYLASSQGIDVSFMLPFYPYLDSPWMIFQYHCESKKVSMINEIILKEIASIKQQELTKKEIEEVLSTLKREDEFWVNDNNFWLDTLCNYAMWDWNPSSLLTSYSYLESISPIDLQTMIKTYLSSDIYTFIYNEP
jgi:zinc protease